MKNENWVGLESHPTDDYVHWSEKNPMEKMKKLRANWDYLTTDEIDINSLKILLDAAYQAGRQSEVDLAAGEGI